MMPLPGEELYGEKPLFNRFSRRAQSFPPPGGVLGKTGRLGPSISRLEKRDESGLIMSIL